MSVQSEIERLEAAKAAIADAIAEKGVEVPAGALLGDMGALIAAIEAGGGGSGSTRLLGGCITFDETTAATRIDLSDYGYDHNTDGFPYVGFLVETGLAVADKTHTRRRTVAVICFRAIPDNSNTSGYQASVYQSSGSGSCSYNGGLVSGMFAKDNPSAGQYYSVISFSLSGSNNYFNIGPTSGAYGPLPGRTYIWGMAY